MSHRITWLLLAALPQLAGPALANPVLYGQQLCVMLKGGISQKGAWRYTIMTHGAEAMAIRRFYGARQIALYTLFLHNTRHPTRLLIGAKHFLDARGANNQQSSTGCESCG